MRSGLRWVLQTFVILIASFTLSGCWITDIFGPDDEEDGITADTVFWQAYTDPGTFDSWLSGQEVRSDAASCLQNRSSSLRSLGESKLAECGRLETGSTAWTECHQERERYNNGSIIAADIATTLRRETRFDQTQGGRYLIQYKALIGAADWNATIALVRRQLPAVTCD